MSYTIHSLEFKLALSCSALDVEKALDLSSQIKIHSGFSETDFLIFLRRHHICELAFHTLKENSFFSNSFLLQLELQVKANQLKAIKGQSIQVKLQEYFDTHHIYAIFLKGILLSSQYYGDIGLRNIVDIDVWIDENNFTRVKGFLRSLGYVGVLDKYNFNSKQLNFLRQTTHDEIFFHESDRIAPVVELHWKIRNALGNFRFDTRADRGVLHSVELNGTTFSVFNHVDQFIFLSVHGAEHAWFKIKWLVDLVHLKKAIQIDWNEFVIRAKELNSIKEVRLAWELIEQLYGFPKPDPISQIKLSFIDRFRLKYILHQLVYDGHFCDTKKEKILNVLYTISLNKKFILSKELLYKNLTNITDWLTLQLPESLFFLYFPLRPFIWVYRKLKGN
jgi:Uncharacterised nucleotidyltransferase